MPQKKSHIEYMLDGYKIEWQSKSILMKENFTILYYFRYPFQYLNGVTLKKRGVDILNFSCRQDLENKGIDVERLLSNHLDYLCEREGKYFMIDVKSKKLSDDRTKNYVYVTRNEIETINYYESNEQFVIKLLIVFKQGELLLYKFFNWSDFLIPKGFFIGKYKKTVRVRLKEKLDLSEFKTIKPPTASVLANM